MPVLDWLCPYRRDDDVKADKEVSRSSAYIGIFYLDVWPVGALSVLGEEVRRGFGGLRCGSTGLYVRIKRYVRSCR